MRFTRRGVALAGVALLLVICPAAAVARTSLQRVALAAPSVQVPLLTRLGFDVTEDVGRTSAIVVTYSDRQRALLADDGFVAQTLVSDTTATEHAARAADERAARAGPSALPSGRNTYRTLADYEAEISSLAKAHPGLVRRIVLPEHSVEGRAITGVEIADNVNRTDDGRPVFLIFGLHHAREWSSGEIAMEFAIDLVKNQSSSRVAKLLAGERIIIVPVVNPDGFQESRSGATLLKRRNCRAVGLDNPASPCTLKRGVDLNRNYGAFWGGGGASTSLDDDTYRGPSPWSEPESAAVHELSQHLQVTGVQSLHNFGGTVLRPPGWMTGTVPDEPALKALGDAMGRATGYVSSPAYEAGVITGATEDWNYVSQGALGYTIEVAGQGFQDPYRSGVVDQYVGTGGRGGLREALLLAAGEAMNPREHGVITGTAPAGRTLRLHRDFQTATSQPFSVPDFVDTTLTVGSRGRFTWHVGPSTRPLVAASGGTEAWTLTCSGPGAADVVKSIVIARGQAIAVDPCTPSSRPTRVGRISASVRLDVHWRRVLADQHQLRFAVRCSRACTATNSASVAGTKLGRVVVRVHAGRSETVRLHVGVKGRKALSAAPGAPVHLKVGVVADVGRGVTITRSLAR